jgi:DNA-binding CsgD family transcriptional regulator
MSEPARPTALDDLMRQFPSPTVAFELASRRIVAANDLAVRSLGLTEETLRKMEMTDLVRLEDVAAAKSSIALISSGAVDGYRAVRHLKNRDEAQSKVIFRIRRITLGGDVVGLASLEADQRPDVESPITTSITIALAVTDHEWIIEHMSSDIESILNEPPNSFIGTPLLSWLEPSEVPRFVSTLGRIVTEGGGGTIQTCLRSLDGTYQPTWTLLVPLCQHSPPRLGMALTGCPTVGAELSAEIDRQLSHSSGVITGLGDLKVRLPSAGLSTRQLEILTEVLQGHRVKDIAEKLFLSQSTVRNHLTEIFKKVGVHSQPELLAKFIRPPGPGSESNFA